MKKESESERRREKLNFIKLNMMIDMDRHKLRFINYIHHFNHQSTTHTVAKFNLANKENNLARDDYDDDRELAIDLSSLRQIRLLANSINRPN